MAAAADASWPQIARLCGSGRQNMKLLHKNSLKTLQETCAKFEIAGVYP
jgi:hypothetical protein